MKAYWGVEVYPHAFFTLALDGGEWSASRFGRFTSRERAPGTHWIGSWVGSRAGLDAVVKRKIPRIVGRQNPGSRGLPRKLIPCNRFDDVWKEMRLTGEVRIIGGGLSDFLFLPTPLQRVYLRHE
jgi:hypothetical protein